MSVKIPEEAKNFKLLGHDASAAWGGGSIVEINKGFAYVGAVGSASSLGIASTTSPTHVKHRV